MNFQLLKKTKWRRRDIILLLERLELYISSGLTLNRALQISGEGISARQKSSINLVLAEVEAGGLLSKAMIKSLCISPTTAGLIEHGESSGQLARALNSARTLLERQDELLKKVTSATAYPVVIGLFASLLTLGLVRGVMPQIIPMLLSLHVKLPILTLAVIAISEGLTSYGVYSFFGFAIIGVILRIAYKRLPLIKRACQSLLVRLPILGGLVRNYALSVFLRSSGSLIESGLSVAHAYSSTQNTVSLLPLRIKLAVELPQIKKGISLAKIMSKLDIPPFVSPLLLAGESSGTLGASILHAADIIDRDLEHTLKRLTSLVEPVMMAAMGAVVGAIALSIMMPIYDISKVLQK